MPPWAWLSAAGAPVCLITGFCWGALRQPVGFDSRVDTISALAAMGAPQRWIMSVALALLGLCHVITALALRPVARGARTVLAVGGVATLLVALFPQPRRGSSVEHLVVASLAFLCLALWPLFARRASAGHPAQWLSERVSVGASLSLLALLGWLALALHFDAYVGLAERVVAVAEALWPLLVVAHARRCSQQ